MKNQKNKKINPLLEALKELLKENGFKRKAIHWCYHTDETVSVVNLQKSSYGNQYYINLGIWIKALADEEYIEYFAVSDPSFPKEYDCHIRLRLEDAALPDDAREEASKSLKKICDLENQEYTFEERKKLLTDIMIRFGLPLLRECSTFKGAIKASKEGKFHAAGVYVTFSEFANK